MSRCKTNKNELLQFCHKEGTFLAKSSKKKKNPRIVELVLLRLVEVLLLEVVDLNE